MSYSTSFDVDQLHLAARKLTNAAAALRDLSMRLDAIQAGAIAEPVAGRLHGLKEHSGQMAKDIGEQTDIAAIALLRTAKAYQDLTDSIVRAFSGGE